MAILRYNPFAEIATVQSQIDKIFEELQAQTLKTPAAELTETDDALYLRLELPGVAAKDVDIEVTENAVKVVAERKTENQERTRSEFYYGKFQRVIPLKARIQNTNVTADYQDGILTLTLPKSEQEKNKVVKVNLEQPTA
ncbi:Hsp20/alpha crystallin family protein [Calothrix sp. FACHB-1219]|uniref:Hsp20/alpha crystallin family protein n=1 Tax=unclassified Calothrix TaxID=2619626 RepID=UPI0016867167|nr:MULTISPECIES: Hsp20/alpha crystallin family protein [unclassified Calothrix]MBD2205895.1 Hsp20/alpha crystallin family protein [Calothrix sp. FACHB-168]MBD2220724.1 Hsp20/alpha crystallin family protein [Calothrix sp. FACHB-1219]